ncbi:LOW QUALITY PROTEIN: CD276 antigen [Cyprinus carpio]|uniref:LOW QUALITY PROTEIN: CD276 antigen n=1 Tax=Cyprinus carpio TaxID=7962 RepID=A0A9Q9VTD5_CYPCA|nr:LOW QUALITY PROTEIN: CD276 antigen [Cyprinus carpio]
MEDLFPFVCSCGPEIFHGAKTGWFLGPGHPKQTSAETALGNVTVSADVPTSPRSGQIDQPDQGYKGSTSLFTEMISSGNASLHIQKRGPQDKGKYRCLVTSSRETTEHFIIVKVEAPIQSVSLETTHLSGFEEVSCSCRDVYPPPCVNLFIEPAGLPDSLEPITHKTADKKGLFSVESKLKKLNNLTYYICLVQSFYRSQTWRASLQEKGLISRSKFIDVWTRYIEFHHHYYYTTLHHKIFP